MHSGRQSNKGFYYIPSVATQQCKEISGGIYESMSPNEIIGKNLQSEINSAPSSSTTEETLKLGMI